jgi:predicted nucleotidyltransferase
MWITVSSTLINDPVLVRFRKALDELYGGKLDRVVLFGSRARGDARADSDYDLAVFLSDMADRFAELNRLADLSTGILGDTGEFVHAMPYRSNAYDERTPLMREIRRDGVELGPPKPDIFLIKRINCSAKPMACWPSPIMKPGQSRKCHRNWQRKRWHQARSSLQ